jgi:hypothetical protein
MIVATNLLALALMAALNPLVARAPQQRGNTPADCVVSDAAPMPRITAALEEPAVEDAGSPLPAVRPVSRSTTNSTADVAELRRALAANDRPAFDAALERAKAAGVATRVYEDIARIWDAQFESPFFIEDSNAYRVASSYPGYAEAVRRQIFTDASGRKFYPAAESRAFVATHVGMSMPQTRSASGSTRVPSTTTGAPATSRTTSSRRAASTPKRSPGNVSGKTASTRTASRKPAASRTKAPLVSPDPPAAPKIAAREPAPVVPSVVDTSSTEAPPAAGPLDTASTETAAAEVGTTDPAVTTESASTTDSTTAPTTSVASSDTTTAAPVSTPTVPEAKGRPILIPAILILIGLGVLIVLFRTKA